MSGAKHKRPVGVINPQGGSYLDRRSQDRQACFDIGMEIGIQWAMDMVELCLHDPNCMGGHAFGRKKIEHFVQGVAERDRYYDKALTNDKEADVKQDEIDREMYAIFKKDLVRFPGRYPAMKKVDYTKTTRKAWKE